MTVVTASITNDLDDGVATSGTLLVSGVGVSFRPSSLGFLRFPSLAVPLSATVSAASVNMSTTSYAWNATMVAAVSADAADNSSRPTTAADLTGRPTTAASTSWTLPAAPGNSTVTTPDVSTVIQEIVNRPGWASGNALTLLFAVASAGNVNNSASATAVLTVTYTAAAAGVTATVSQALRAVTQSAAVKVTVPTFHASIAQALPATTQRATGPFVVSATVTGPSVALSWADESATYAIERDGQIIAFGVTGTTYTDTPGDGAHTYRIGVIA